MYSFSYLKKVLSVAFVVLGVFLMVLIVYNIFRESGRISKMDEIIAEQQKKYEEFNKKKETLKKRLQYNETIIAKQRNAHERGYLEEGENVVVIEDSSNGDVNKKNTEDIEDLSFTKKTYIQWYEVFFGDV